MSDLPIWLLNLERSPERRAFMEEQFKRLDLEYEIFKAVDGLQLSQDELACYSRQDALRCSERELLPTEIGCALSHARIWQRIVEEGLEKVLVFEDDILIGTMMPHILRVLDRLPPDWEFINFVSDAGRTVIGDPVFDIHRVCRFNGYFNRLGAYMLTGNAAKKLLKHVYPIRWPADALTGLTHITGLIAYGIDPQVAALRGCHSDIHVDDSYLTVNRSCKAKIRLLFSKYINAQLFLFNKCFKEQR